VDVDDFSFEFGAEGVGKDLHEAGKDDELDVLRDKEVFDFVEALFAEFSVHLDKVEGDI